MDNDNIVLWVALIGIVGTLGGVYLGNWLQSRNIKQQREWMLQDQKREWVRRRKEERFERILMLLDETQKCLLKIKLLAGFSEPKFMDEAKELTLKYSEHLASFTAIRDRLKYEDQELANLLSRYCLGLGEMLTNFTSKGFAVFMQENEPVLELAGKIQQRINELLEGTFD